MQYLAHRGYWLKPEQKNSAQAFSQALQLGFGIETDIRDHQGQLVIAHDLPLGHEMLFTEFLSLYQQYPTRPVLALNIKADGLQLALKQALTQFSVDNYFAFDMSVPDGLMCSRAGLTLFTRQSELETKPLSLYQEASGVWIDCFFDDWITESVLQEHLQQGKKVALVSPELHKRDHLSTWHYYKNLACINSDQVYLCTDFPEAAQRFFA